jgi:4-hydroxy-tetrahydrodipicolinate reductase
MGDPVGLESTYRVVQWATGNIGTRSLRAVIEHPQLTLAGLYVTTTDKEGRDAGDLCGLPPTGVVATRDIADILALEPDCVLYMQQGCDFDAICTLLETGVNVVATCGEFHHPESMDPADRERVEAACERGASSIHGTGSSPGFISEAVPIVLTSIQRRLDKLQILEFADVSSRDSPAMLFDLMGFGNMPADFDTRRFAHGAVAFGPSLRLIADAVGMPLDAVESTGAVSTATRDVEIAAGSIRAGTVAAQRMTVSGLRQGQPLLTFSATWYCSTEIDADWDLRDGGWRVIVDGDCPLDVEIRLAIPLEEMAATTPGYTANRAVNAVPMVCDAAPGIRTTVDLPQIVANLSCGPGTGAVAEADRQGKRRFVL